MPKAKATSPARSQGGNTTPKRKTTRGSRSLCSPALSTASGRLTSLIDQFKDKNMESFALSPLNGRSVLNDNTEIEEPRRKSWWKKLGDNSQDVMEVLEENQLTDVNDMIEEFIDIEVLSQERKNYTLDLPESSDNESINSIVLPQRRLFTQKENQPQKKYGHLIDNRESLAKLHKTNTTNIEKTVNVGTRELFQNTKRSKPIFPAALLHLSPNKTKENMLVEPKPQVRNIFGNRPANKRKNMFTDFIVSESEDEIPDIQPKIFGFQKKIEQRRVSSISRGRETSPASSITTDIEMDFRMLLPSSTMVENQLEDNMLPGTPIKRARLSKLSEAKESEAGTNTIQTNTTGDKTKQSNKSVSSKNKSKASPEVRDKSLNSSRTTRSMLKNASKRDENVNILVNTKSNKSLGKNSRKGIEIDISVTKSDTSDNQNVTLNKFEKRNKAKNSLKAVENEIESEENVVNAIDNVTRVINKTTNRSLPNTTATNRSVNEKERTVTIKVHKTGSKDVEQNEEEDENNFTLQYENDDNDNVEGAEVHNEVNEKQKYKTKTHITSVSEKEIQETDINNSKIKKSMRKEPIPAKTVEESVESQTEQYSADDNIDGNVEQKKEMFDHVMGEDVNNDRKDSIEQIEQDYDNKLNISRENENEGEESEPDITQSEKTEDDLQADSAEAGSIERDENDDQTNESQDIENDEEESEADVNQSIKMADDLQIDSAKAKAIERENDDQPIKIQENGAHVNQSIKMADNLQIDSAKAKAILRDNDDQAYKSQENRANVNQSHKMDDDLQIDSAKAKAILKENNQANKSQKNKVHVNQSHKMADDLQIDSAKAKAIERENDDQPIKIQENGAVVNKSIKMADDLQIDNAEAEAILRENDDQPDESQESEADVNESMKMEDDLQIDSAEAEAIEKSQANESQESEADVNQSMKMDDDLEIDSAEAEAIEKSQANESQESEADVNQSMKMDDDLEIDSAEAQSIARDQNDDETDENQDTESDGEESEADVNQSHKMDDDLQIDSAEADRAMASDPETSDTDDNEADEMENDDDEEEQEHTDESQQSQNVSSDETQNEEQKTPSIEEIEQSPNITHDTTGRYRKKDFNKSPEVILHDKTNQMDSFTAKGRNTSVRKTKSMIKNLNIRPSLAPPRNSTGFSDGATNSSAEGSGWDSHRTTRKTLRQTFGKDFTPRKSLRALVMEKSAKRQTEHTAMHSETVKFPLANSTEMAEDSNRYVEDIVESDHELSRRTRQTTLEMYLDKIKEQNIEKKLKMEQAVRNSLKVPVRDSLSLFKVPNKPAPRRPKPAQTKPKKQIKSIIPFDELPSEVIEDMKYKPPKRFQPTNASWITKRLYNFLENKLEPKYDYKARVRAEKLVETIYHFAKDLRRHDTAPPDAVEVLKHELARLDVVRTHFDFYEFFHEFMPREIRVKVVPDIVNKIPLPRHGVFSDILRGNTVQG